MYLYPLVLANCDTHLCTPMSWYYTVQDFVFEARPSPVCCAVLCGHYLLLHFNSDLVRNGERSPCSGAERWA